MTTSMHDIRQACPTFFSRDTMRFFDSRIMRTVYDGPGGVYFCTSEQFHGSNGYSAPRKFSVRQFRYTDNGPSIITVGHYNEIPTGREAATVAKRLSRGEEVTK